MTSGEQSRPEWRTSPSSEAAGRLSFLLNTGKLQAFHFDRQGGEHILSTAFWQGISDTDHKDIFNTGEATVGTYKTVAKIVVREDDLAKIFPPEDNAATVDSMQAGSATKTGRPKHNWDAIWAGIVLIQHEEGLEGKSQEEIIEAVQVWYQKSFGKDTAPSRSALQPRIRKLLAVMKGKEPSIVFQSPSKSKARADKTRVKSNK